MHLELYHRQNCPFSARVRRFIQNEGLKSFIEYHDIDTTKADEEKLKKLTGIEQVPCLVLDGKPMLESEKLLNG